MYTTETHLSCTLSKSFPQNFLKTRVTNLRAPTHEVAWRVFTSRILWISSRPRLFRSWWTSLSIPLKRLLPKIHEWYLISCSYAHVAFIHACIWKIWLRGFCESFPLSFPRRQTVYLARIFCINIICIWSSSV